MLANAVLLSHLARMWWVGPVYSPNVSMFEFSLSALSKLFSRQDLYDPGWPQTRDPTASWVLGLKIHDSTPGLTFFLSRVSLHSLNPEVQEVPLPPSCTTACPLTYFTSAPGFSFFYGNLAPHHMFPEEAEWLITLSSSQAPLTTSDLGPSVLTFSEFHWDRSLSLVPPFYAFIWNRSGSLKK